MSNLYVRVVLAMLAGLGIMAVTYSHLRPEEGASEEYKFMHCNKCGKEMPYNATLAGLRCPTCPPLRGGTLVPTTRSMAQGGGNPWRGVNIALSFETVGLLGVLVFILYHPPKQRRDEFWRTRCPKCRRKLKFPAERGGTEGRCPGCKHVFIYPPYCEDQAERTAGHR
jgi:hypothetical protein